MTETAEEREIRLQKRRAADKRRREHETPEQRASQLDKQSADAKRRRLEEATDKREARLENKSSYEKQVRAKETLEKRKARLEGKSSNDRQHRKIEIPEKRTMRLEKKKGYNDARRRQRIGLVPAAILTDEAIKKFHYDLSSLEASKCNTCHESLPSLTDVNDHQCQRCGKDSFPQLYSADNNMDPGCVPSQLQVNTCIIMYMLKFITNYNYLGFVSS